MYTDGQTSGTTLLDQHWRNNDMEVRNAVNMKTTTMSDDNNVLYWVK